MSAQWLVRDSAGDAGEFHLADAQPIRSATFHAVSVATLVLGSAQRDADVNDRVARALGIAIVKRRSGGGAVLLVPGEFVWLDLVIPASDALWVDDIGQSMMWVGQLWQRALAELGVMGDVNTATGGDVHWAKQVCFAGIGSGEVVAAQAGIARKVVGISQRRTRAALRFQSMCHLHWRPELVAALVAPPRPRATDLAARVAPVAASADAVRNALVRHLPSDTG